MSVDLLSILLLITLAQGLFILSVLVVRYKLRPTQHLVLFFMVIVLMWFQVEFLSVRLPYDIPVNAFYGTRFGAWLLLGPLFYFYVQSIVGVQFAFSPRNILHFVPFIILVCLIPIFSDEFLSFRQVNYGMLTTFDPFNDSITLIQYIYSIVFVLQFIHLLVYLIYVFVMVRRYERNLKGNYSALNSTDIRWLKIVDLSMLLVLAFVSLFLVIFFITRSYNRNFDYLYVLPTAMLIYLISYKLAGVQWLVSAPVTGRAAKYEKSSLKPEQAQTYLQLLEHFVAEKKPYLNNELRLFDLAEMVGIPPHHLSQVINEQLQTSFFDYINRSRIDEAKRLIKSHPDSSLLEIAFKAGFNNKTSFTNAFKKFSGQTPLEFRRSNTSGEK